MNGVTSQRLHPPAPGKQPASTFKRALKDLLAVDPSAQYAVNDRSNSATFLSGTFQVPLTPSAGPQAPDAAAREFLGRHGRLFGIASVADDVKEIGEGTDALGMSHFKYQQMHAGLPVFGQQVIVHAKGDTITAVGGRTTPNIVIGAPAPKGPLAPVPVSAAVEAARKEFGGAQVRVARTTLGIHTNDDGMPSLAYELDLASFGGDQRERAYVDAKTGQLLESWSLNESVLNRDTYDAKNATWGNGTLVRKEGDGPTADPVVNAAHDNAGEVYNYYKDTFNRDSLDNRGMKLISVTHYGQNYNNAYWNGRQMTYGDGDGELFRPLALGEDVGGHENTHGVTEKTAALKYSKQPGALNESMSDVFGELIEQWTEKRRDPNTVPDWQIGEDVFTPKVAGDALRSLKAPGTAYANDPQPAHMKDYKDISYDNGGVHINSGIPNKAAYEVAQRIGTDKLEQIWYRTLTNYLTSNSQFSDAANASVQAAIDLYGKDGTEVQGVRDAWTAVGLTPAVAKPPATA